MGEKPAKMLTVQEVADLLHAHPNTIRNWCDIGLLEAQRIGPRGDRRFRPEDVDRFLLSCRSAREEKPVAEKRGHEVLVVDDDLAFCTLMKDTIEEEGCKVTICDTGEAAQREIEKKRFDLLFLDLVLPGISGLDILRSIKAKGEKPVIAVITGYGDDPIAMKAMELGPMFFLRKPFDVDGVTEILNITFAIKR